MSEELNKVNDALRSESVALKGVIEQLGSEKDALTDACSNLFNGNLSLSAALKQAQKRELFLQNELLKKNAEIKELSASHL